MPEIDYRAALDLEIEILKFDFWIYGKILFLSENLVWHIFVCEEKPELLNPYPKMHEINQEPQLSEKDWGARCVKLMRSSEIWQT